MNFQKQMFGKVESVMDLSEPPGAVEVRGIAAKEEVDAAGEKLSYQDSKPAFRKWSDDTKKRSRGLSVGNLRNMHGKVSAGKVIELTEDDANKCFRVVAQVIDTNSANLARTGCLTGFSVGGDYDKTWPDPVEKFKGKPVRVFTPILVELSIVDAPCSPSATFDYVKLDGSRSLVKFQLPPADAFLQSLDEHMAQVREQALELGKLISPRASEGTFSTGKDEEGKLITADHHRGAAVSARQSGDEPKAKSLEAQAASLDAWDRNTADAHTKAAQAHTAAYEATLASGNEPAAIGHQASAAGHELKAKELSEATSKCLTDALLEKYSEDQPRDDNGKFSSGGGGNAPTEPVDSKFADRHPFVSAFLDTHNTGEKAGDYLRTVPDDKLRTAARLVANTQDIGSHTVRTYIEREAQRRGIALKAATPDSLAKEARHEADPVTAAIAEYLKLENVSVTDEEIQKIITGVAALTKAKVKTNAEMTCPDCKKPFAATDTSAEPAACPHCGKVVPHERTPKLREADKSAAPGDLEKKVRYLVSDETGDHLPVTDEAGKPSHTHMGAAHAALNGGYRGQKYDGPDKEKAKAKLKSLYESEGMEAPGEKAAGGFESLLKHDYARALAKREAAGLAKSLYDVGALANMLESLAWMQFSLAQESKQEGDNSKAPGELKSIIQSLISFFQDLAKEESDELIREEAEKAAQAGTLTKAAGNEATGEGQMTPSEQLVQRLAKMTPQQTADYLTAHVQKMEKKASALQKAATHLKKAEGCHEKMGKCLDKMGTGIDTLTDHVEGMKEHMGGKSAEAGELQKALSKSVDEATAGIKSIHEEMVSAHEEMADEHELISGSLEEAADEAAEATAAGIAASEKGGEKMAGGYAMRKMQRQHDRERVEDRREFAKTLKASQTAILGQFKEFTNGFTNAFAKAAETGDIAKRAEPARMALVSGDKSADGTGLVKNVQTDPTLSTPGSGAAPTGGIKPTLADGRTPNPEFLKLDESQRQDILEKNLAAARPMEGMKGMMALQDIQTVKSQTA